MDEAQEYMQQQEASGYPTTMSLLKHFGQNVKNRIGFDFVDPRLTIESGNVLLYAHNTNGPTLQLFNLYEEPLISQMIYLKPFLVPENFVFFIEWTKCIYSLSGDPNGRQSLFGGSDKAELWFGQQLPAIDISNPIQGALQTLQFARQ